MAFSVYASLTMPYALCLMPIFHPKFMPSAQTTKTIPLAYIAIIYIQSAKFLYTLPHQSLPFSGLIIPSKFKNTFAD
jgi:hypothetical protein